MKALFLIFHGFDKANGISKKIHYQVKALKECGVDARLCYYDITPHCERRLMIDNEVIADFGTGTTAKVWKRIYYAPIIKYARREKNRICLHPVGPQRQPFHAAAGETSEKYRRKGCHGNTDLPV